MRPDRRHHHTHRRSRLRRRTHLHPYGRHGLRPRHRHAAHVRAAERRRLGIANTPIADVFELIASQGIWASGVTLPDGMSGLFLRHSSIGLAILVNSLHPKGRKRFSYAHEYAHALLDRNGKITISSTDNSSELVEKRANAFAAAFLMPRGGIRSYLRNLGKGLPSRQDHAIFDAATGGHIEAKQRAPARSQRITYKDIALLAHHFGVSYQAAVYRLRSLRYISGRERGEFLDRERFGRKYLGRSACSVTSANAKSSATGTENFVEKSHISPSRPIAARNSPVAGSSS